MNEKRLLYKAYLMLLHLDEQGKNNWVTKIRTTLFRFGFGYVWQNKGVQEVNLFIRCFTQRLIAGRTGRVELMPVTDLIFTDNLRRIMCKQHIFQLILIVHKKLAY